MEFDTEDQVLLEFWSQSPKQAHLFLMQNIMLKEKEESIVLYQLLYKDETIDTN